MFRKKKVFYGMVVVGHNVGLKRPKSAAIATLISPNVSNIL